MPRFKIETSLFEPVTIEVEGGRTFESVPLSPALVREIQALDDKQKDGQLDAMASVIQQVALIFGADVAEIEKIDVRILNQILIHATEAMVPKVAGPLEAMTADKATATPAVPVNEAPAEKNASRPGSGPTLPFSGRSRVSPSRST